MLIRLVPAAPHPTVLFAITFQNLPDNLPNPFSWTQQLSCLSMDDLEMPRSIHSLDKSAVIPCIVEEISFDIPALTVSCRFIDGSLEEWPLMGTGCLKALENVLKDVNESALETEREKEREKEIEKQKENLQSVVSPPASVRVGRHRKQRSLLMTLVASLVPSSSPSSLPETPTIPPCPANPTSATLPPQTPSMSPRALRRRARSTLVDTFRLHVLSELTRRLPQGGYYTWVVQSMLRRASDRLAQLVQQAGGQVPDLVQSRRGGRVQNTPFPEPTPFHSPCPFYSDEDGEECEGSDDTDTDGSSIHTPSSSHFRSLDGSHHAQHSSSVSLDQNESKSRSSRTSFSPFQSLSPKDLAEYTAFSAMTLRLRQLLLLANARSNHAENEMKHHEAVLEIRSRRRAWLNKSLVGGPRGGNRDVGLAMPFQSSRLGQCSWSDEDFDLVHDEYEPNFGDPHTDERIGLGLGLRRTRCSSDPRLFPVSEEEEDEGFVSRELELEFGLRLDLEGRVGWRAGDEDHDGENEDGLRVALEIERPKIRPRVRTSSMHRHRLDMRAQGNLGIISPARPQPFNSSSILCQPLTIGKAGIEPAMERPPAYAEVDVDVVGYGYVEEEFTLAMDLPYSVKVPDREELSAKRKGPVPAIIGTGAAMSVAADGEHEYAWLTPGLGQGVIVDCR